MFSSFSSVNACDDGSTQNRPTVNVNTDVIVAFPNKTENRETAAKPKQTPVASHQNLLKQSADVEIPNSSSATSQPSNPSVKNDQVNQKIKVELIEYLKRNQFLYLIFLICAGKRKQKLWTTNYKRQERLLARTVGSQ